MDFEDFVKGMIAGIIVIAAILALWVVVWEPDSNKVKDLEAKLAAKPTFTIECGTKCPLCGRDWVIVQWDKQYGQQTGQN